MKPTQNQTKLALSFHNIVKTTIQPNQTKQPTNQRKLGLHNNHKNYTFTLRAIQGNIKQCHLRQLPTQDYIRGQLSTTTTQPIKNKNKNNWY